jgi:hypothetical protein
MAMNIYNCESFETCCVGCINKLRSSNQQLPHFDTHQKVTNTLYLETMHHSQVGPLVTSEQETTVYFKMQTKQKSTVRSARSFVMGE